VAGGLIVFVVLSGPFGVINNVGTILIVTVVELGEDALFNGVFCAWKKIILSAYSKMVKLILMLLLRWQGSHNSGAEDSCIVWHVTLCF
jgi:hypothetical protein